VCHAARMSITEDAATSSGLNADDALEALATLGRPVMEMLNGGVVTLSADRVQAMGDAVTVLWLFLKPLLPDGPGPLTVSEQQIAAGLRAVAARRAVATAAADVVARAVATAL